MAVITPIRGIRYSPVKIENMADVVTPPYDVISLEDQEEFYQRHPHNIIRLELGKTFPDDSPANNRYTRAARLFRQWLDDQILIQDEKPSIYIYQQQFQYRGLPTVRTGFICGLQLVDYAAGIVLPHEETIAKHKEDRLQLLRYCHANFSPIFGFYVDKTRFIDHQLQEVITSRDPEVEFTDDFGIVNRLWVVQTEETLQEITQAMRPHKIFIADGHHRYETALHFSREMKAKGLPGYDFVMINLVNLYDEGLVIYPTHRLVKNLPDFNWQSLENGLRENFVIKKVELDLHKENDRITFINLLERQANEKYVFGLYLNRTTYLLTLRPHVDVETLGPSEKSTAWKRLPVTVLHTLILEKLLGISKEQRESHTNLTYTRDEAQAVAAVDDGSHQMAFFLTAPHLEDVVQVADAGDKMPQKSTYFYPKLTTGLVINPLGPEIKPET
ncbi:DUF1015 domain-containing protein [Calderihabitans maritimus]|uniref:DUF1015 domain-containing protein n=1 Tax=Calderihabitans maritimus TaxID=1246530 RepID=A0A1Z5HU98_9FIRM|nr:DUF1015 domain-containing protein [Calderihabitans maritimus]GAW92860.1 hypothetical protein TherJR_2600 [Calderihabitans maritimus]